MLDRTLQIFPALQANRFDLFKRAGRFSRGPAVFDFNPLALPITASSTASFISPRCIMPQKVSAVPSIELQESDIKRTETREKMPSKRNGHDRKIHSRPRKIAQLTGLISCASDHGNLDEKKTCCQVLCMDYAHRCADRLRTG